MKGAFVLDCSVTMAWFFDGDATPVTDEILDHLNQSGSAIVAAHWPLEVTNTLLMGERRKRCTPSDSAHFMGILSSLAIDVDRETGARAFSETFALARTHSLTQYDAAYLELAMRNKIPLATLDADLRKAAKKAGVECWPQRI